MSSVVFTLTSARTGTLYLAALFRRNALNCASRHEPFFDWGNPTLFGRSIEDAQLGRLDRVREALLRKRRYIEKLGVELYIESSHAFLKSAYRVAWDVFPEMKLIHLIRHPLEVAKSEAYREEWRRRVRAPFHFYRGEDGGRYFRWALTGKETIFRSVKLAGLSRLQWYLLQWIELENRAMAFLAQHQCHDRCLAIASPRELNDDMKVRQVFDFVGVKRRSDHVIRGWRLNRNLFRRTTVTPDDEAELDEVVRRLPPAYLEIFRRPPYTRFDWSERLRATALEPLDQPSRVGLDLQRRSNSGGRDPLTVP